MSPSRLDNFINFQKGVKYNFGDMPEYSTEEFINDLLRIDQDQSKLRIMNAGTAVHSLIEHASFSNIKERATCQGWDIISNIDAEIKMPFLREKWVKKTFNNYIIRGKVDAISSHTIHDLKTTKSIDLVKYFDSMQWRAYLWMTGYHTFTYDILQITIDDTKDEIQINDYVSVSQYRYKHLDEEVEQVINDYAHLLLQLKEQILFTARKHDKKINTL